MCIRDRILWQVLTELISEIPTFKKDLEIKLIGAVSQEVLQTISLYNLDLYLNNLGYVSHKEAIAHQRKSQVLLLIEIDSEDTKSIIQMCISDRGSTIALISSLGMLLLLVGGIYFERKKKTE